MRLGVTMYASTIDQFTTPTTNTSPFDQIFGHPRNVKIVDCVSLFNTDIYIASMHRGHAGGKISAFKQCVFLKNIGSPAVTDLLLTVVRDLLTPLRYLHLLQGGRAIRDVLEAATAFSCRD